MHRVAGGYHHHAGTDGYGREQIECQSLQNHDDLSTLFISGFSLGFQHPA
jgi:hypothetical protein